MKPQRVLVLVHETLVPPEDAAACSPARLAECLTEYEVVKQLTANGHEVRCLGLGDNLPELTEQIHDWRPHVAFNLTEEFQSVVQYDQHLVSYLELLRQPYTGCNPRGLTLSRDKVLAKQILHFHSVATPGFVVIPKSQNVALPLPLRFPLFVKSTTDDASLGISQASIVNDVDKLQERVAFIHEQLGSDALVEEFIAGRELYVGVIGNERVHAYPVWEMQFGSSAKEGLAVATRNAKWNRKYRQQHGIGSHAAQLTKAVSARVQRLAKRAYQALSLSGYARMDFRMDDAGELYLLEANANPCLTSYEDFAQSAAASGDDFAALLERIVKLGKSYRAPWRG